MFEIVVSDRFAAWYDALPEPEAEEVTLALEVAAGLGAAVDPERSRELLLWYDGARSLPFSAEASERVERFSRLMWWGRRVSQCLESPAFAERLAELDAPRAREALLAVERVKNQLAGARLIEVFGALHHDAPRVARRVPLSGAERWLFELIQLERQRAPLPAGSALAQRAPAAGVGPEPLHVAVLEALHRVGLSPRMIFEAGSGLREITLTAEGRRSRVIVGVDVARERLIAILGEPLDREYYGDSVKFAEAFFRDYLARQEEGTAAAP
jgi:hypothetical protein